MRKFLKFATIFVVFLAFASAAIAVESGTKNYSVTRAKENSFLDILIPTHQGNIEAAITSQDIERIRGEVCESEDINTPYRFRMNGQTLSYSPLVHAIRLDCAECVKVLIECGADVHQIDRFGAQPIHHAVNALQDDEYDARFGNDELIEIRRSMGWTAYWEPHMSIIDQLLAAGVSVDTAAAAGEWQGWTPLHFAAKDDMPATIRALYARGANIDSQDAMGRTPIYIAVYYGEPMIVFWLYALGANLELWGEVNEGTVMDLANKNGNYASSILSRLWTEGHSGEYGTTEEHRIIILNNLTDTPKED